jgi:hypothetical protein
LKNAGSGTGLTINQYTEDGVSFVRFADAQAWYYYDELIPFDPTKLYVVRARVRQWTAPTIGGTSCFIGVEGVAEDRTTMIGTTGVNAHANQHYVAAAGSNLVAGSGWKEFVGYIKGYGTPINGSTSPSNPSPVYLGVAYIRPMFLFNYSGGNGSADIDYCILEMPGNIEVQTNFNGAGWQTVQSGDNIPGIVRGADLTGKTLQVQQLYSVDLPITPILHSLQIEVEEQGGAVATIGKLLKVWSKGRWQNPQYCTSEDGVTWGEWQDIQPFEVVEVPYPGYYKVRADGDVEVRNYKEPWNETDVVVGGVVVDG